jgi:F-type H+-transporting ATPase subunit alpha
MIKSNHLKQRFSKSLDVIDQIVREHKPSVGAREMGTVSQIGRGVAEITGLPTAQNDELLRFPNNQLGYVFNLDRDSIGCVMLDNTSPVSAGDEARRTHRVLDVPVGQALLGRVIDPVGRPLDGKGEVVSLYRMPIERPAPSIIDRAPVSVPLQTGIKVIDALVPIGRGQRQLIVGDRQTGKTSVALDTIINQRTSGVVCVYCAIGQRSSAVAGVIDGLNQSDAINDCVVVVGESDATPGLQFAAPYAATSIGEYFMEQGRDVLVVYDELTSHARAYREMSLLLRRPPGREAYPGDIFYVHARLLERATCLKTEEGGGSLTALPIVETEAQNVSAYIPTNLISITDGQVYLSPERFRKGILPAVDVGRSVSRVGGKAQLAAYRSVTGPLRLAYSQFEELEKFARFSSQLDDATRQTLRRGQRVRELLKQNVRDSKDVVEQVIAFVAVTHGVFDDRELGSIKLAEKQVTTVVKRELPDICMKIVSGNTLIQEDVDSIVSVANELGRTQEEAR